MSQSEINDRVSSRKARVEYLRSLNHADLFVEFIKFKIRTGALARRTIQLYQQGLEKFLKVVEAKLVKDKICNWTIDDIMTCKEYFINKGYMRSTIKCDFTFLGSMFSWLRHEGVTTTNWKMSEVATRQSPQRERFVPNVENIFLVRRQKKAKVRNAVLFELILSTGLRNKEVRQLRLGDIRFTHNVHDIEEDIKSPYVGGTIILNRASHALKTRKSRVVYLSRIAANLMKVYIKVNGLEGADPSIPLFPFNNMLVVRSVEKVTECVHNSSTQVANQETKIENTRKPGFMDIDSEMLKNVPEDIAKKIILSQKNEAKDEESVQFKVEETVATTSAFHEKRRSVWNPHAIRHLFAMIQHYRSYFGLRGHMDSVRKLLGHTNTGTTQLYLSDKELVCTDKQWKQIMLGVRTDYQLMKK